MPMFPFFPPFGMGNEFPYTNFHDLNLNWIICVIKDFYTKYNTIDDKITTGKTELESTYNRLMGLLNQWYTTHSSDIENELTEAINSFTTQAQAIGLQVISTIPQDYTNLSTSIELTNRYVRSTVNENWIYRYQNGSFVQDPVTGIGQTAPISVFPKAKVIIWNATPNLDGYYITCLAENDINTPVSIINITPTKSIAGGSYYEFIVPENVYYISVAIAYSRSITILVDTSKALENTSDMENLFDKRMAFSGWYYFWSANEGVTRNVASWAGNSPTIPVHEGDTITFKGVTPATNNYFAIIYHASEDINDTIGGFIAHPYKSDTDGSYFRFVVPHNVPYISFGFSISRADLIKVYKDPSPYNAKLLEVNALGDSITHGHITPSVSANPTWCQAVATKLNCKVNNYGVNASSICNSTNTFLSILNSMTETWIDCLIIFGGTNDYGDDRVTTLGNINSTPAQGTNFYASFKNLIEQALTKYPMAQIMVVTPLKRKTETANAHGITLSQIADAEIEIAKYYGVPVCDLYHESSLNPAIHAQEVAFTADGLHPNQEGINLFLIPRLTEGVRRLLTGR